MPDNTTGDIRSIIKNATQWLWNAWNPFKKGAWVTGKGDTIATKEEITTERTDNNLNPRPTATPTTPREKVASVASNNLNRESWLKSSDSVVQATNNPLNRWSIFASNNTNPNEINNGGEKINNVEINGNRNWNSLLNSRVEEGQIAPWTINSRIPEAQKQAKQKQQIDLWNAVRDLYTTAYAKNQKGETLTYDYVREKFPEFNGLSDEDLYQLASDATYLAQQWEYSLQNAFELADAYGLDTALMFDELDPKTKWEYISYLATQQNWKQSPGLLDRVIWFWLDKFWVWWDATFQDYLNSQQEGYDKARSTRKEQIWANLADLKQLFNNYKQYYKVTDAKALNNFWKSLDDYTSGKISMGELDDMLEWWGWFKELDSKVKWTDESKKEEFRKAYNDWKSWDTWSRIKNFWQNALFDLADLWIWAYTAANHIIDFAKWLWGLALWTVENTAQNIWVMPKDTYAKLESTWPVGEWFAWIMKNSEESADMIWDDYIIKNYWSLDNFMDAVAEQPFLYGVTLLD